MMERCNPSKAPTADDAPVRLNVIVATLHGCDRDVLDDTQAMADALDACVEASGLTMIHKHVHKFQPEGVTGAAILAESHIALHSWPARGLLFVDIATCLNRESAVTALERLQQLVPHRDIRYEGLTLGESFRRGQQDPRPAQKRQPSL